MKKASKAIAFAMASAMAVSMAACGGSASSTASGAASGDSASATGNGSYDQITYAYATFNNIPTEEDLDVVEEEINKITREKIGAEITLKPISIADYVNKVSLSLQGGEKIDVYQSLGNFGNCVSTDMCYDISDLIDSCAPETKALLGDKFLDACKVNGKLYGMGNTYYERPTKILVLLHGYNGGNLDWALYSNASEISSKYNLAVILPSGENSFYLDSEATGHKYATFVGQELIDYVRNTFHLSSRKEDTFVGGLSMGGFGAIHTALQFPDTFEKAFSLSGALIVHNVEKMAPGFKDMMANYDYYKSVFGDPAFVLESDNNPETQIKKLKEENHRIPGLYMAIGTEDFLYKENQIFRHFLEEEKIDFEYHESTGVHDFVFWNANIEPAVRWLLGEGIK